MSYSDSARGITITRKRALQELRAHALDSEWDTFLEEVGDRATYRATDVLEWLGY